MGLISHLCTAFIATYNSHQSKDEQRTVLYFEHENDHIHVHLPINLLGIIVNRLSFSHDNVFSMEYVYGLWAKHEVKMAGY